MNRDAARAANEQSGAAPRVVDLRGQVPQMTDGALENFLGNARRLIDTGSKLQQVSAAQLIPVVETELTARNVVKAEAAAAKKAAVVAKKAAVKKAAA